jgi:hypothetical protein
MIPNLSLQERIEALSRLGDLIRTLSTEEKNELFRRANNQNSWFSEVSVQSALDGLSKLLEKEKLERLASNYTFLEVKAPKNIGILMAGNIPGVGFHDLMSVLIAGHIAVPKLSSADSFFTNWLIQKLLVVEPRLAMYIRVEEMLKGMDAYIATGSDNSARYFHYYFGKYPSIIRSNRSSIAILTG